MSDTTHGRTFLAALRAELGLPEHDSLPWRENLEERLTGRHIDPGTKVEAVIEPGTTIYVSVIVESNLGDCDNRSYRVRLARRGPRKVVEVPAGCVRLLDGRQAEY